MLVSGDGKAGSLIDDQGHFYKPLQRGPRGNRELAFYNAVDALVRAEQAPAPAVTEMQASRPVIVPGGGRNGAAARDDAAASALPWHQRRLRQLFPSFKGSLKQRGPMAIMQRDELGLLSGRGMAKLGLGGASPKRGTSQLQQDMHRQQQQQAERAEEEQAALSRHGKQVEEEVAVQQYGQSPDSDDLAEHTGRHLMEIFHEGSCTNSCICPDSGVRIQGDNVVCSSEQQPGSSSKFPHSAAESWLAEQQAAATITAAATAAEEEEHPLPPLQAQQEQQGVAPARSAEANWEHRHVTESPRDAYTLPEHAQTAALLGQPTFGRCLSVDSNSKPFRSPFVSELLHHSHPPPPLEGQQQEVAAGGAAAEGGRLADALAQCHGLGPPLTSSKAFWLHDEEQAVASSSGTGRSSTDISMLPFSLRNAPLLRIIPKYYGVAQHDDERTLLELEDLARAYRHPCIIDIKVGFRTWYPQADEKYIQRCREKDESTTQAALGFKICGMQVFRHGAGGYWRASKRWCKTLPLELVDKALLSFAHNEYGLRPADVYSGAAGAIVQLEALEAWFSVQRDFHFYSSSVLLLYEGDARSSDEAKVRVRMVDFAHTFQAEGGARDTNFLAGLRALLARLHGVMHATLAQELAST